MQSERQNIDPYSRPPHDGQGNVPPPKPKNPIYKKWWFWLIIIVLIIGIASSGSSDKESVKETNTTEFAGDGTTQTTTEKITKQTEKDFIEVGETISKKDIKMTFISAEESYGSGFTTPDQGNVYIHPLFEIKNNSNKEIHISSLALFNAYVDGYTTSSTISAQVASDEKTLNGYIAPGKMLKGTYSLEVSEDWQEIEIHFSPRFWRGTTVVFKIFND